MVPLPSYKEATAKPDWLRLVAPYVRFDDYRSLCLVNRRSWRIFAPCLWADLLRAVRRAGLDPGDDLAWWFDFVFNKLDRVAPATRSLVRVLDARDFAKDAYHFASDGGAGSLGESFARALELLPNANSILLDGHADLDAAFLVHSLSASPQHRPRLLSVAGCPKHLPASFFTSSCIQKLVYLDVSEVPGSVQPLLQAEVLPNLRVLKLRSREIDDATLEALLAKFRLRLWSLDLAGNKLTDATIEMLASWSLPRGALQSDGPFRVQGSLRALAHGTPGYGQFVTIDESQWSASFSHPERYFVDAPVYVADVGQEQLRPARPDGVVHVRSDSAEASARILSKNEADWEVDDYCQTRGLTHISLSNTRVSSFGIQKLLRVSSGHLEELACSFMPLLPIAAPVSKFWPKSAMLHGILGSAHLFRPAYSCSLRSLKMHHSLVTNVPALEIDGFSAIARDYLAEAAILERVDQAYPQVFVPDMNPRLTSLTLTGIPRRSSGPLVQRLIRFLELLSRQERAIQDASAIASPWRGPGLLQGLRHLALEFEPDTMDDGFSATEDLDAEELMDAGDTGFSFFNETPTGERRRTSTAVGPPVADGVHSEAVPAGTHPSGAEQDTRNFIKYDGEWNGEVFSLPVWVGPTRGANEVLDEYRRLVMGDGLRDGVGPATPGQILAGAPEGSFVFHVAWCAAVMPRQLSPPGRDVLAGMKDVLAELRTYRLAGRASYAKLQQSVGTGIPVPLGEPHFFWTGTLKVSTSAPQPNVRSTRYWQ
ncbi:leucine rich repeat domain-containing protein [Purpureocillium lilacinum]|uniref:Leucine rich repeat domain-containing protein n=1 Tax=Purpureocillium lilacinum TaxID=33203 RepID=A0A179HF37_PURLI|nr:leucine rich repeat domain-containing protein [Purpureocillium lilacinum]OAQ79769.1 leucine rich repeat domain-containing protein [Purpureocillium lilacinum]OAQ88827.1 leucine rich repeat domain-containing protein [Purpureocillium lilacinum]GJN84573.1 hypothetical protein PLIIFM63780_008134 [Purpureocillium lilacinum]